MSGLQPPAFTISGVGGGFQDCFDLDSQCPHLKVKMSQTALARYAELKQEIDRLSKEMDELKEEVFKFVDEAGGKHEDDSASFRCQKRPKYKFLADYDKLNGELKDLKKKEIDDGIATISGYSEFVVLKLKD